MAQPIIPSLRYTIGSTVVPGDRIGRSIIESTSTNIEGEPNERQRFIIHAGPGTYQRAGIICSSIVGTLVAKITTSATATATTSITTSSNTINTDGNYDKDHDNDEMKNTTTTIVLSVEPSKGYFAQQDVLTVGQVVLGRIVRIHNNQQQQSATVSILAVQDGHGRLLHHNPEGTIRKEDVQQRMTTTTPSNDKQLQQQQTSIQNSFRVNDYIIARIISLGDTRRYILSTAESSLGVIHALSAVTFKPMTPISWKIMQCPDTGVQEFRKCAIPPTSSLGS